jgi:hypothetical protein
MKTTIGPACGVGGGPARVKQVHMGGWEENSATQLLPQNGQGCAHVWPIIHLAQHPYPITRATLNPTPLTVEHRLQRADGELAEEDAHRIGKGRVEAVVALLEKHPLGVEHDGNLGGVGLPMGGGWEGEGEGERGRGLAGIACLCINMGMSTQKGGGGLLYSRTMRSTPDYGFGPNPTHPPAR